MKNRLNSFRENGGIEIAINPNDLRVSGNARILEGQLYSGMFMFNYSLPIIPYSLTIPPVTHL